MNYRIVMKILGRVLLIEAGLLTAPLITCAVYGEDVFPFVWAIAATLAASVVMLLPGRGADDSLQAREGFVSVALSWIVMTLFGAIPFVLSGVIPNYIDALFEIMSGFTTTGASVLTAVEGLPRGIMFWRSFSHFIGGMGVLVFMMAVLPMDDRHSMHLMRAEVPGPVKGKLVPRMRTTARILYLLYIGLTFLEFVLLLFGHIPVYDALLTAFGTTATGGFGLLNDSIAGYHSVYVEMVVAVFMFLSGINFNLYYIVILKRSIKGFRSEELGWYLGIAAFATVTIALSISRMYGGFVSGLRYSVFQVASIMTSTGYATADFNLWPAYARSLLLVLMIVGACAGSTGGGTKIARLVILVKIAFGEIHRQLFPRSVPNYALDGERLDTPVIRSTLAFYSLYAIIALASFLLLSLEGLDLDTTLSSVIACMSNIGPGLGLVGASGNFSVWSAGGKVLLIFCMLLGRLEIFPVVMLVSPGVWVARKK